MERLCSNNNLIDLFQKVSLSPLNQELLIQIEQALEEILDSKDYSIFNSLLLHNFILLLRNKESSSFYLNHLIHEIELKSLRLVYSNRVPLEEKVNKTQISCCENSSNKVNQIPEEFVNKPKIKIEKNPQIRKEEIPDLSNVKRPPQGSLSLVKDIKFFNDQKITTTFSINHEGQVVECVERIYETIDSSDTRYLNDSLLFNVMAKNLDLKI